MGKMQRRKGSRIERELVQQLIIQGYDAKRVPLSGATTYAKGDVEIVLPTGNKIVIEVKSRKDGFKTLYKLPRYPHVSNGNFVCDRVSHAIEFVLSGLLLANNVGEIKSINTLMKLKKDCNILAIKANNKPFLFLV